MLGKKVYTKEDLMAACSKLPQKELEAIWQQFDFNTLLWLMNVEEENRTSWKNQMSELLHRELDKFNAINRLFDMLPSIDYEMYTDESVVQKNEDVGTGNNDTVIEQTEK